MPTTEISKAEWRMFCDEFSKAHEGEKAVVQVMSSDLGAQEAVSGQPFVGVSYEEKGSEQGDITLLFGVETDDSVEHRVESPIRLWHRSGEGAGDALEFEGDEDEKTILQLTATPALA